jgi:dGTPase
VSDALIDLKAFNLEYIYLNPKIKQHTIRIKKLFELLFEKYLSDIQNQRTSSVIFRQFLKDMTQDYTQQHQPAEIVRDFISGMTDQYFLDQCPENLRPRVEVV